MSKFLPKLYSRRSDGSVQEWQVEIEENRYRAISGMQDGKHIINSWTECFVKNDGKANATTAEEQAEKEAKALWQKKHDKGYREDVKDIDSIPFFEPMLAKKYEDYRDDIKLPVFAQFKLDGSRCIVRADGMWSRNGKLIISAPHIFEVLQPLFEKNPDLVFDGELYCDKFKDNFNAIMSLVKRSKPTKQDLIDSKASIQYWIYDLPSNEGTFSQRNEELLSWFDLLKWKNNMDPNNHLVYVETQVCKTQQELDNYYGEWLADGFEGQMVRLDAKYENKRTKSLLKRKEFQDAEYEIVDVIEGEGNRTGIAGAVLIKDASGKQCNSNIKGNREYCRELLKNKKDVIGKMGTIKFFNLTPDGVPRFPFLISVRDYE